MEKFIKANISGRNLTFLLPSNLEQGPFAGIHKNHAKGGTCAVHGEKMDGQLLQAVYLTEDIGARWEARRRGEAVEGGGEKPQRCAAAAPPMP